jgi:hypothetical protein
VIVDAEVPMPAGFVACLAHALERDGLVVVTYTAPGTWPGGVFVTPVWIADYPFLPACFINACPFRAHQFSDNFDCRGVVTDCSVNEGILSITQRKPLTPARRRELRKLLGAFNRRTNPQGHDCQHPPFKHAYPSARYNHACLIWSQEVR